MSILAQNLKTIRKELGCTQSVMASILKVGFRTYVRYEAGERDAPVAVLVKISKLGNLSLENLLTMEVDGIDVAPVKTIPTNTNAPEVKSINFKTGQAEFRKPSRQEILAIGEDETKMVTIYRKMEPELQQKALKDMGRPIMDELRIVTRRGRKPKGKVGRPRKYVDLSGVPPKKPKLLKSVKKKKGKPGRKKLDKKVLKEKIDKLKLLTRSVNKITVK